MKISAHHDDGNLHENDFMYKAKNLIPKFSEDESGDFFWGFEEVAETMSWEKEMVPPCSFSSDRE